MPRTNKKTPADDGPTHEPRRSSRKEQPTPKALLLAKAKLKSRRPPIRALRAEKDEERQGTRCIN